MEVTFPQSLIEATRMFADEDTAWNFAVTMRWADGVSCPFCECERVSFLSTRKSWKCSECKKQFSVKTGTIFQGSPLPVGTWLVALWLIMNCKNGISSYELAETLGVSQQSAWFMGHRLRSAMKVGTLNLMRGTVEVDETYIGGKAKNMHTKRKNELRKQGFPKVCVMGLVDDDGQVRTGVVANNETGNVHGFIRSNVEEGTALHTDSHKSYNGLAEDYDHSTVNHDAKQYVTDEGATTNHIEGFWSGLKRTYHGSYIHYTPRHTHRYCAEQEFRHNQRGGKAAIRFLAIMTQISGKRLTYRELIRKD